MTAHPFARRSGLRSQRALAALAWVAVFLAAVASGLAWVRNAAPEHELRLGSQARSPLSIQAEILPRADWCPEDRALRARIDGTGSPVEADGIGWSLIAPEQYAVYVDGVLRGAEAWRITRSAVDVCLPAEGSPRVLVFGLDSVGRPIEFDSAAMPRQAAHL